MKKWLFLVLAAAAVAGAAYGLRQAGIEPAQLLSSIMPGSSGAAQSEKPGGKAGGEQPRRNRGPAPVETAKASLSQISDDVPAIGTLLADESVAIAPETSGRVAKILFTDGDTVAAGKPLFQLDPELAEAALAEAKARLDLAEANFVRNQTLRKSGNVAQSTFEAALTEREVARAAVESARVLLEKLTITAPFSGTLGFRNISEGAYVTAGTVLVQLDKIDRLKVSFSVPELQQAQVAAGQTVQFSADALPGETFSATVSALNPSIDVNGRALQIRADLDNSAAKLKPGLLVRVTVKGKARQAVSLPEAAVVQRGNGNFVFRITDNKAAQVKVQLGKRFNGRIEVIGAIAEGDEVATAGNTELSDGADVEVVATAAAAE